MYMAKWNKAEVDEFLRKLFLSIYYEFCAETMSRKKSQADWEAGWDTLEAISKACRN